MIKNKLLLGFGSVGVSSLYYLDKKLNEEIDTTLFLKDSYERVLEKEKNSSPSSALKYNSVQELKERVNIKTFNKSSILETSDIIELTDTFPFDTVFTITGLGGSSADALLILSDVFRFGEIENLVNFCIMPFGFEGTKKNKKAEDQLELFKQISTNGIVYIISNQDLLTNTKADMTFNSAFEKINKIIENVISKHKTVHNKIVFDLLKGY